MAGILWPSLQMETPVDQAMDTEAQRRMRIGEIAYDRVNNRLYVLELFGDGGAPVVHVWKIK